MILGKLIYCLFASMATVGFFFAVRQFRTERAAWLGAAASLLFFVLLYIALDVFVLSKILEF